MKSYQYLPYIKGPEDLKKLSQTECTALSSEIRRFLVGSVLKTGGHLASNLGIVELTLAMHRVFDSPKDHFIFDVGHQAYVHKLITGRGPAFPTLRQNGGLSGFTKRTESPHDPFGAGHASTSLSAAIGMATAEQMKGSDAYTVCVVGDGAFTGGMIHEALNNINRDLRLIIILNENEMSISPNTGRFATHMAKLRATEGYYDIKNGTRDLLRQVPLVGEPMFRFAKHVKQSVKDLLYHSNYFEDLGLYYLGPADGNDLSVAETLLEVAKEANQSVIIHFKTKKGKGWAPAETAPDAYHGVSPQKTEDSPSADPAPTYSDIFGRTMLSLLEERRDIRIITAAMTDGTGLRCVADARPDAITDVGIAEEHAITYAAGLAAGGVRAVAAIYSSFLQRAYDNLLHDAALQHLPIVLGIDRAGFNEGDGPTHHGIFDVAMLSALPDTEIDVPVTYEAMERFLRRAMLSDTDHLTAVRYPKGRENTELWSRFAPYATKDTPITPDYAVHTEEPDALIVTYGRITAEALAAKKRLAEAGISAGILLMEVLTPYAARAEEIAAYLTDKTKALVFLEEGVYAGGAGMILRDLMYDRCLTMGIRSAILAIKDPFAPSEKGRRMVETAGIDAEAVYRTVTSLLTPNE